MFSFNFWTPIQRDVPCPFDDLALYLLIYPENSLLVFPDF